MMTPRELKVISEQGCVRLERTGAHSHIRGLGLNDKLEPSGNTADGLVGQASARKAAGIVVKMIKEGKVSGRGILLTGQPGSGKTAIAMAIAKSLDTDKKLPFVSVSASELFSLDISKSESLMQAFRKAIMVQIKEEATVLMGEVVEIQIQRSADSLTRMGKLTLKTTDMETVFDLGQKMIDNLIKAKVSAGDIISINKSTGSVDRMGRNFTRQSDYDALGPHMKFMNCPDGEVMRKTDTTHEVSLHEIDVINSRQQGFMALFSGDTGEIKAEDREKVNARVSEWYEENKADVLPGVLFIDEVHMLDIECFSFLNRALEAEFAPLLILATNRGVTRIRGTNIQSPHGLPRDFLDRLIIIRTEPYSLEDIAHILQIRAEEEDVKISSDSIMLLAKMAKESTSLRYTIQLITAAEIISKRRRAAQVETEDIGHAYRLFIDVGRSKKFLEEHEAHFGIGIKAESDELMEI